MIPMFSTSWTRLLQTIKPSTLPAIVTDSLVPEQMSKTSHPSMSRSRIGRLSSVPTARMAWALRQSSLLFCSDVLRMS